MSHSTLSGGNTQVCEGCLKEFSRKSGYINHLQHATNPRCAAILEQINTNLLGTLDEIGARAAPNADEDLPIPFEGDFFGEDYTMEDLAQEADAEGQGHTVVTVGIQGDDESDSEDDNEEEEWEIRCKIIFMCK